MFLDIPGRRWIPVDEGKRIMRRPGPTRSLSGLPRRWQGVLAAAVLTVSAALASCATPTSPALALVTPAHPCAGSAPRATYSHVVVILMENKDFNEIIGSPSAPYLNTLAKACGLATQYHGVTYPSLPNYIAATSGATYGIRDDNLPA